MLWCLYRGPARAVQGTMIRVLMKLTWGLLKGSIPAFLVIKTMDPVYKGI